MEVPDLNLSLLDQLAVLLLDKEKPPQALAQEQGKQQVVLLVCGGSTQRIPQASKLAQYQF